MSEAPDSADRSSSPDRDTTPLLAGEVQKLALEAARAVADRLADMFQRFRRESDEHGEPRGGRQEAEPPSAPGSSEDKGSGGIRPPMEYENPAYRRLRAAAERGFDGCLRVLGSLDEMTAPLLARGLSGVSRSEGASDVLTL